MVPSPSKDKICVQILSRKNLSWLITIAHPEKLTNYASSFKKKLKITTRFNVANKIHKANVIEQSLDELPMSFLLKMDKFFDYDINLLSRLIKKDLSKWRVS